MYIYRCTLTLHEPLFFATREVGRLYETGRHLHNYALAYAFGRAQSPWFHAEQVPHYAADLNPLPVYITPAAPLHTTTQLATFKYGEEVLHVEMQQATRNTPSFGRAKELAPASSFACFVLSTEPCTLPRWIRLGKWHSKTHVAVEQLTVTTKNADYRAGCTLNPLDMHAPASELLAYDIVSMPPGSLAANAHCRGEHYVLGNGVGLPTKMRYQVPEPPAPKQKGKRV